MKYVGSLKVRERIQKSKDEGVFIPFDCDWDMWHACMRDAQIGMTIYIHFTNFDIFLVGYMDVKFCSMVWT